MTRILWYTDATNASSVSGASALGTGTPDGTFGTAKSRTTTRVGIYDIINSAFVAAGWTDHNNATRDDVYTSTGESGNESINCRTVWNTLNTNVLNFLVGTKINGSNLLQGAIGTSTNTFEGFSLGSTDFTADFIILATKDFIWGNFKAVTAGQAGFVNLGDVFSFFMGNLERDSTSNNNVMITSANISAGSFVSIPLTSNPQTLGYQPGDFVQIVSQAAGDAAQAQTLQITNTSTSTIEVESLALGYSSGARIGASPLPIVRFVGYLVDANNVNSWYMPLSSNAGFTTSDLVAQPGQSIGNIDFSVGTTITAQDGFGTGTTANKRTRRFGCRSLELRNLGDQVIGRVPGIYGYPGTNNYYPSDTCTLNRTTPHQRFVAARFTAAGTLNWIFGKSP